MDTRAWPLALAALAGLLVLSRPARGADELHRMPSSEKAAGGASTPGPAPTLEATQRWLEEKSKAYGSFEEEGAVGDTLGFEGCRARKTTQVCDRDGKSNCVQVVVLFSLADLQQRSVRVVEDRTVPSGDGFDVCVETVGGRKKVKTRSGRTESSSTGVCFFLRDDDHLPRRFARALAHAIALCQEPAPRPAADEPF
jgi:hypothetical protein